MLRGLFRGTTQGGKQVSKRRMREFGSEWEVVSCPHGRQRCRSRARQRRGGGRGLGPSGSKGRGGGQLRRQTKLRDDGVVFLGGSERR